MTVPGHLLPMLTLLAFTYEEPIAIALKSSFFLFPKPKLSPGIIILLNSHNGSSFVLASDPMFYFSEMFLLWALPSFLCYFLFLSLMTSPTS